MMRRLTLLAVSAVAAIAAGAVLAGTTSADPGSTVGGAICPAGSNTLPCGSSTPLNLQDWGGMTTGAPGSEGSSATGGYHCNNVLYLGPKEDWGTRNGTTYYTVGNPRTQNPFGTDHTGEGDCSQTAGDNPDLDGNSVVLLRFTFYLNSRTADLDTPSCPRPPGNDQNPGCPNGPEAGKSAGYIGVGRGNEPLLGDFDAGVKGNLP